MLIRTVGQCDAVVFGGEQPGIIVVLSVRGAKVRVGFQVHPDVPIVNLKLLKRMICGELSNDLLEPEKLALRSMLVLLENPQANAAAITELLAEPALVELTCGLKPDEG